MKHALPKISVKDIFFSAGFIVTIAFLLGFSTVINNQIQEVKALSYEQEVRVMSFKNLLPAPAPYPVSLNTYIFPEITAKAGLVMDLNSSVVLYKKNSNLRLFPASTTKIMTGLVSLENYNLDQILEVKTGLVDGSVINLDAGEKISVRNLLYGLLVASGNDAAQTLAENYPNGVQGFVEAMNNKAVELNLNDTNFTNPMGYDQPNHYTSAKDLARLTSYAISNNEFTKFVSTPEVMISDINGENITLKNTNLLVGKVDGVMGVKTGLTDLAGECLVTLVERDEKKVLIVLLGSSNRFGETQKIIDWVYNNFHWQIIQPATLH